VRPHVFRRGSISLLSILLVGSVLRQASATALVAVKTPTEVVIGADSLAIISFPGSGPRRIPFCKIRRIGSIVFALSSNLDQLAATDFYEFSIAEQAVSSSHSVAQAVDAFAARIQGPLHRALVASRKSAPDAYRRVIESGQALTIIFAGYEKSMPVACSLTYLVEPDAKLTLHTDRSYSCHPNRKSEVFFSAPTDAMVRNFKSNPDSFKRTPVAESIRNYISIAIAEKPDLVGPPIVIIRIDKSGIHWVDMGACAGFDLQNP